MKRLFSPSSFVVGVLIGAALGYYLLEGASFSSLTNSPATSSNQQTALTSSTGGSVTISNQAAGMEVTVESVTVPPPGVWVAVREVLGTDLGNVLGAVRVQGPRTGVVVPLLRGTQAGGTYAVELYRDNGDGVFDLSTDSVYVDLDTGERVVAYFAAL